MHKSFSLILFLALFRPVAFASVVQLNDGPYFQYRAAKTLYIYDENSQGVVDEARAYNEAVREFYDKSFGWSLDEEEDLILTSKNQQIGNAYATVSPNLKTVWYPSGGGLLESAAASSWLTLLVTHETAHLYQLNAKGPVNSSLKPIFGNAFILMPLGLVPIFIHPNQLLPRALLEGNAVFNEARFNQGGRLHSGEARALVLAQIQAGDLSPTRLINDEFLFPYGDFAYLQGGYFQAHLAAKYGVERTNRYFLTQAHHFIWPFIINKTFRQHFGSSFYQEVREHVREMAGLAKNQKAIDAPSLFRAEFISPLNHNGDKVFFLTTDQREPPVFHEFDKRTRQWRSEQIDLLFGKVFFDQGRLKTAATFKPNLHAVEYSLYGKGAEFDPRYRGQIVTDQRAGQTVALDAGTTWLEPQLLLNGETYDVAHSSATLDESGHVYYFRQNGLERILYRDRQPLFKYDGFFGKPAEVAFDGTIYFIANTDYGSSLFQWRNGEIARVLNSDRVVDARKIGDEEFLVTEVNAHGQNVVIAHAEPRSQMPATYTYGFTSQNLIPQKLTTPHEVKTEQRSYNSFREIRFSSLDLGGGFSNYSGFNGSINATFSDPLEYQTLSVAAALSQKRSQTLLNYDFDKYLPDFYFQYFYDSDTWITSTGRELRAPETQITAGLKLPFWKWQRWSAMTSLGLNFKHEDNQNDPALSLKTPDFTETYGTITQAQLQYSLSPGLGFLPWRRFSLSFANKLELDYSTWAKRYNTSAVSSLFTYGFPREFYATLFGKVAWAERANILVSGEQSTSPDIRIDRLTSFHPEFNAKSAGALRLELQKAYRTPVYSNRIPLGLNRTAPLLVGQGLFFNDDRYDRFPQNTFEWGYGADFEFLLAHMIPFKLRWLESFDTRQPYHPETKASLSYHAEF
jgi:hypothetical protein